MTTAVYKLTSPLVTGGAIYLAYRGGKLSGFDAADAVLTEAQLTYLLRHLPVVETELATVDLGSMRVQLIPAKTAKDKVILFCQTFKTRRGVSYVATQMETSNIRTVPVTTDLLAVFFDSPLSDFTIGNYIRRINITKDRLKNGADGGQRMPAYYDARYEATLTGNDLMAYHRHLLERGWRKEHGPAGTVWKRPPRTPEGA